MRVGTERRGIDLDHRQPPVAAASGGLRHEGNPGQVPQPPPIAVENLPAADNPFFQRFELAPPDARQDVAHPVVEADFHVFVPRRRLARLLGQLAGMVDQFLVARRQHASARRRDDLVSVERVGRRPRAGPGMAPAAARTNGLRRVANHRNAMAIANGFDPRQIARLAVQVGRDHRFGRFAAPRGVFEGLLQQRRIHVPARLVAIDERQRRPLERRGRHAADEGQRGSHHFIPGAQL